MQSDNHTSATQGRDLTILRLSEVLRMTGLSKTVLYNACRTGDFPQQVRVMSNRATWLRSEVEEWIQRKAEARRAA